MDSATVETLLALNRSFYDKFARDFARTRRSSPPGFDRIVPYLRSAANVVDLGCGNGRLLAYLASQGWHGHYVGLDNSVGLLGEARDAAAGRENADAVFLLADLMQAHWPVDLADLRPGDAVTALAVLHHIPGSENRTRFMETAARLLPSGGHLIVSTWQFMSSPRLRKRLLSWGAAGLRAEDIEPGDHLMSWGEGAAGQRYVAAIGEEELLLLSASSGLEPVELFTTDGLEGDLNLYGVFRRT